VKPTRGRVIPIAGAIDRQAAASPAVPADDGAIRFTTLPPLALYVHLPWCVRKCPYCDFNSHEARAAPDFEAYVDALIGDVEAALPLIWGRPVVSLFLGGGTPSLLPVAALTRLLDAVRARLPLRPDLEVTLEANPGAADEARSPAMQLPVSTASRSACRASTMPCWPASDASTAASMRAAQWRRSATYRASTST
jgi:oxygen-independent coproporphyrinogen-3 oxidase